MMKKRTPLLRGVIYVATLLALATFHCPYPFDTTDAQEWKVSELVQEGRRSNRLSQRLSRPSGLPPTPGCIDGDRLRYHACKTRITAEKATSRYPENCLIIWTADWCPLCPRMNAIGKRLTAEGYAVVYVNFDENRVKARAEGVRALPTAIVHRLGKEVHRVVGITARNQRSVEAAIRKTLRRNNASSEHEIY